MHLILSRAFIIVYLLLGFYGTASAQQDNEIRLSGQFRNISLVDLLGRIEAGYPVKFFYKDGWFEKDTVDIMLNGKTVEESVREILTGKPYTYRVINKNQFVFLPRENVAMLEGHLLNYSDNSDSDLSFIQVGKPGEAGKSKTVSITGRITDGKTSEPVIAAIVQVNGMQQGAVTSLQGNYKLTLAPGLYTLVTSSVGYEKAQYNVKLLSNGELNIELFDKSVALEDIIIYGQRLDRNVSSHQMSLVELDSRAIDRLPAVSGGKDVLKGLTTMPGVKSVGEFSSGINVRGGGEDQNLYLINGTPLFNTSHVFGLFSVINPDAVDKLTLYKGHIPAVYGERVSSVIDIRTNESAPEMIRFKGGIGLYDGKLMAEVPVFKDKVFIDLGGRTNYSNWILHNMKDYDLQNSLASFYDLNGTLHAVLPKGRISISGYNCYDAFRFASEVKYSYGSTLGSLNWNYLFNSNLASYLSLSYSQYNVAKDDISKGLMQSRTESGITYSGLKYRIKYGGIQHHTLDAGFNLINYDIHPGKQSPLNTESLVTPQELESEQAYEGAVFVNDEYTLNKGITFNAGLRLSGYRHMEATPAFRFEPRLSAKIQLNDNRSVKLSYNRNFQYLSLISYSSVSTPADIWKLSDSYIRPLEANQFAVGYYRNFLDNSIETSVEIYYKSLANVIEYKDGAVLEMNTNIENELINAQGKNFGVEFLLKKNSGKIDGWISYTYSRSLRKTSGLRTSEMLNNNTWFPSSYDKPHDLSVVANIHLNKRIQFSSNFSFSTGRPITLPEYRYFAGNEVVVFFSDKNQYRIPTYHRLDITLSLDESLKLKKKWKGRWSFSILNVYGRKNAYTIYYKKEDPSPANNYNRYSLYKLYLIGRPIPSASYSFIF